MRMLGVRRSHSRRCQGMQLAKMKQLRLVVFITRFALCGVSCNGCAFAHPTADKQIVF